MTFLATVVVIGAIIVFVFLTNIPARYMRRLDKAPMRHEQQTVRAEYPPNTYWGTK